MCYFEMDSLGGSIIAGIRGHCFRINMDVLQRTRLRSFGIHSLLVTAVRYNVSLLPGLTLVGNIMEVLAK